MTSRPPSSLSPRSRKLWKQFESEFELQTHHRMLLELALQAVDRCEQARLQVEKDGPYHVARSGRPVPHPGLAIERDSRLAAARLLREIGLDDDRVPDVRPPRRPN